MKLDEFHVLQREPGAQHHGIAVARACMRRGGREISAAIASRRQDDELRPEPVNGPVIKLETDDAAAAALLHDEVDGEEFDKEFGVVPQGLTVQRVQHRMAGAVGRRAGALRRRPLAEVGGHAAERALIDAAIFGAREWHAPMLKLIDGSRRIAAEIFDRILIAEPIRPLDGVVHVPFPIVRTHIGKRRRDTALRRDRVRAGRKDLGDTGRAQPCLRTADGRPQPGAASADDDNVECVIGNRIGGPIACRSGGAIEVSCWRSCHRLSKFPCIRLHGAKGRARLTSWAVAPPAAPQVKLSFKAA